MKKPLLALVMLLVFLVPAGSQQRAYWPTRDWRTSSPGKQGMDGSLLVKALDVARRQNADLHSVLVIRHGFIVMERYFPPWTISSPHELYSCTKSFVSTLAGIAAGKGGFPKLTEPILGLIPGLRPADFDRKKRAITLENMLTMSSGLGWVEADETYRAMYIAGRSDWAKFVLDLPMVEEPGKRFNYSSGGSHIIVLIIQAATGMDLARFAQQELFDPLGIRQPAWDRSPAGDPIGGWGLRLTPRDMAKLGYLFLNGGTWDGQQLVPADWVRTATAKHIDAAPGWSYGYLWWVDTQVPLFAALGRYGQAIYIIPSHDLVVVFTARMDDNALEMRLVKEYIVPACGTP